MPESSHKSIKNLTDACPNCEGFQHFIYILIGLLHRKPTSKTVTKNMKNQSNIDRQSRLKSCKIEVLGVSGRLLDGSRAAPGWLLAVSRLENRFWYHLRAPRVPPGAVPGAILGSSWAPWRDLMGTNLGPGDLPKREKTNAYKNQKLKVSGNPNKSEKSWISEAKMEPNWMNIGTKIHLML